MRGRALIALVASAGLNAFAVYAACFSNEPSGIAMFFLMPGEFLSGFVGANTVNGPYWAWAVVNAFFDWPLILGLLLLLPVKQRLSSAEFTQR